jgi:O-antigen/teichoic acid export membrane protein
MSGLITTFQVNLQTLLVGAMNSIAGVGVFSVAANLNSLGNLFSSSINTSSRPIIAELHDRRDHAQLEYVYQTTAQWSLTVNLPVFLIMVLFPKPILSIFGPGFTEGSTTLVILACANLVNVGTGMGGIILDMTGHTKLKLVNSIIRLVLHLVLNVLLIPRWGIVGAALAFFFAESTINLVRLLQVYFLMGLLPYSRSFVKPIAAGALALAATLVIGALFPAGTNLLYAAIQALLLVIVYGALILLFGLSPLEREMLARLRKRASAVLARLF